MSDQTAESSETLSVKFHKLWLSTRLLDSTFGPDLQKMIDKVLPDLLIVQKMVDQLSMFSINEDFEDLTNSTLPFILLDGLIGICYSKKYTNMEERKVFVEEALKNYKNYKLTCIQFEIGDPTYRVPARGSSSATADVHNRRNLLIQSSKEEAELNSQIVAFLQRFNDQPDTLDDEFVREMYLKCITHLNITVTKDAENLQLEAGFLKNPVKVDPRNLPKNLPPKRKPMLLAKNEMQKKVFGMGYPSLPSMTVEEFADLEISKVLPSQEFAVYKKQVENMKQKQESTRLRNRRGDSSLVQEEDVVDRKDEETVETLAKARNWDEFKDDHKRGEGNRMGMG